MPMRVMLPLLAFLMAAFLAVGCGSSGSSTTPDDGDVTDGDGADGDDSDGDGSDGDVTPDGDEDGDYVIDGDQDEEDSEGSGDECDFAEDCTNTEDCVDGVCVTAKTCLNPGECNPDQICWKPDRQGRVGRCRLFCTTDMNCGENGQCIDGLCQAYQPLPTGAAPPKHPEWNGKLHANFAEGILEFPFPTTMGGYGGRSGPSSPYQEQMGAPTGMYDRLRVKALSLDDGENRVVFVTLPICFPTDYLVSGVVKRVIERGGPDLRNSLVLTGSHTHNGPARFWNILPDLSFGALGFDKFSWEIYQRMVDSMATVVLDANDETGFRPARWGYAIHEQFDPDNTINRDRRSENDDFKDNRMMLMRIDEYRDGGWKPWTLTLTYATHGTIEGGNDTFLTDDAPGGAVNMTQLLYERDNPGESINVMFFNGMAGDISQAGGDLGHRHTQQMQVIGYRVYDKAMELFDLLETGTQPANPDIFVRPMSDTVPIRVVSKRIPIDRDYIGYTDSEFFTVGAVEAPGEPATPGPFRFGAFQCGLLTTPVEENLDLYVYDGSGGLIKSSTRVNTGSNGESVTFAAATTGTYYIRVIGAGGSMAGYKLHILELTRGSRSENPCFDAECGRGCEACPQRKSQMAPAECNEDYFDSEGRSNDSMAEAALLELNSVTENLQVCPHNEDWFKVELTAGVQVRVTVDWNQNNSAYNPETRLQDGRLGCALVVEDLNAGPMPQFGKTRLTAILLGDLYLAGLPGESSSRIGDDTVRTLEAATDFENIVVFGYTNDHHFYISTEDDWFQGGYNTSMSIWGYRFGPFLIDHLKELAIAISEGREQESASEYPLVKPLNFRNVETPWRTPLTTNPAQIGVFAENPKTYQPQDTVRMEQQAMFRYIGADPGVDFPHTVLQRCINSSCNSDGDFETVMRKEGSGRVYDDTYYEFRLEYANESFALPNKPDADPNNYWTITWEETYSYPLGTYRFKVDGHYYDGSEAKPYTVYSNPFELLPTAIEVQAASFNGTTFSGSLRYRRPVSNDTGDNAFEGVTTRALVLHDPTCEPILGPQVHEADITSLTVTLTFQPIRGAEPIVSSGVNYAQETGVVYFVAARDAEGVETVQSRGNRPLTRFTAQFDGSIPGGDYRATVQVTDRFGNEGQFEMNVQVGD